MSIRLTDAAARRVAQFLARDGGVALRLGVRRTGCSGWAYDVSLAESIEPADVVFEDNEVTIVIDPDSLPYLDGSSIDFVADGLNHTFRFENPNATEECGCGESFTIG
jgi:iron-sulfur cluster assembly protein